MTYTVGDKSFEKYLADARRYAMRRAIETGEPHTVCEDGAPRETWERGKEGGAKLTWEKKS